METDPITSAQPEIVAGLRSLAVAARLTALAIKNPGSQKDLAARRKEACDTGPGAAHERLDEVHQRRWSPPGSQPTAPSGSSGLERERTSWPTRRWSSWPTRRRVAARPGRSSGRSTTCCARPASRTRSCCPSRGRTSRRASARRRPAARPPSAASAATAPSALPPTGPSAPTRRSRCSPRARPTTSRARSVCGTSRPSCAPSPTGRRSGSTRGVSHAGAHPAVRRDRRAAGSTPR